MEKEPKIEYKCEYCGNPQPTSRKQSTCELHVGCICGGKFVLHINGKKVG